MVLAVCVIVMALVVCVLFVTTIAIELRNAGVFVKESFEDAYGCKFAGGGGGGAVDGGEWAKTVFCHDKIPENLKQLVYA